MQHTLPRHILRLRDDLLVHQSDQLCLDHEGGPAFGQFCYLLVMQHLLEDMVLSLVIGEYQLDDLAYVVA